MGHLVYEEEVRVWHPFESQALPLLPRHLLQVILQLEAGSGGVRSIRMADKRYVAPANLCMPSLRTC